MYQEKIPIQRLSKKGIRVREFNNHFINGTARFRRFPGSKSKQMLHYITPTLVDDTPEHVILHVGTNDLPTRKENPTKVEEIAQTIVDIGKKCILYGVKTVFISEVITRSTNYMEKRRFYLNRLLKEHCEENKFIFIENKCINECHLLRDGVHLNEEGNIILANNFLNALNTEL